MYSSWSLIYPNKSYRLYLVASHSAALCLTLHQTSSLWAEPGSLATWRQDGRSKRANEGSSGNVCSSPSDLTSISSGYHILASCSVGLQFKSGDGNCVSWFSVSFLSPCTQMSRSHLKLSHGHFLPPNCKQHILSKANVSFLFRCRNTPTNKM
jgi:hypothetical protein